MKVALILSVVALVAVSQPTFSFPAHPFQPCSLINRSPDDDFQCCWPPQFGGCRAPPNMRGPLPPNYLPPPDFLMQVCCNQGHVCCPVDKTHWEPRFKCCAEDEECIETDNKGECTAIADGAGGTPEVDQLESTGQCPLDGSLAVAPNPNDPPLRCTLNEDVAGYTCPTGTYCVRDNSGNVNSGVCCRETTRTDSDGNVTQIGCDKYTDCQSCVRNEDQEVRAACGWLTLGSLDNNNPRCVVNCDNFPSKSCVLPSDGRLCPADSADSDVDSTVVNTGTCQRRCGYIGTGRAVGINNIGNRPPPASDPDATTPDSCCLEYPGDYCCDYWHQIAGHCNRGRAPDGPLCGIPVQGTPNALYVPEYEPLGPYIPAPYGSGPTPYGPFPPYGQPYGYGPYSPQLPYGPYPPMMGPGPMPYGPGPVPYGQFYGPVYRDGVKVEDSDDIVKQLMYPPPPMYYPQPPPPVPRRIPSLVDINPSPFVCSCDLECNEYQDCCEDYSTECTWDEMSTTTTAP